MFCLMLKSTINKVCPLNPSCSSAGGAPDRLKSLFLSYSHLQSEHWCTYTWEAFFGKVGRYTLKRTGMTPGMRTGLYNV